MRQRRRRRRPSKLANMHTDPWQLLDPTSVDAPVGETEPFQPPPQNQYR